MSNNAPQSLPAWTALSRHKDDFETMSIAQLFEDDAKRFEHFHLKLEGLLFDYSKHIATKDTLAKLCDLARGMDVEGWREKMFSGAIINESEGRAVLHTALRSTVDSKLEINGIKIADFVSSTLSKIQRISEDIRSNSSITDVVNIGVGGSDLGPHILSDALAHKADGPHLHFIANIDGVEIERLLGRLDPKTTVFIIASKTFETFETMANAHIIRDWVIRSVGREAAGGHFYAVSMNEAAAVEFGIAIDHILPLRNWIGGRFSVWGAIGLPIAIANGFEAFNDLLEGARCVDEHFQSAPLEKNIPVLMALLGIWYHNFWDMPAHAVLPYSQSLQGFPSLVQQLDMESNGKCVDRGGRRIEYTSAAVTFGDCGTNGQHAFFQALHQGTHIIPADFIAVIKAGHGLKGHHAAMLGNALAQSQALMQGDPNTEEPHRNFEGNRPSSTILLDQLDAYHLGGLLALYEHKVFVQGVIWNVNSFDQWGVELGKKLAAPITQALENKETLEGLDSSTQGLIQHILQKF